MQTFLRNGDQQVGGYGNPDLCLDGVLAGAEKHLDTQVLFDPLEEQIHLLALIVKVVNQLRLQGKVIGQKHQVHAGVVPDHHPAQRRGVILARIVCRQNPVWSHSTAVPARSTGCE